MNELLQKIETLEDQIARLRDYDGVLKEKHEAVYTELEAVAVQASEARLSAVLGSAAINLDEVNQRHQELIDAEAEVHAERADLQRGIDARRAELRPLKDQHRVLQAQASKAWMADHAIKVESRFIKALAEQMAVIHIQIGSRPRADAVTAKFMRGDDNRVDETYIKSLTKFREDAGL